jgi:hypothetical protein
MATALSDDQLREFLQLISGADTVELKLTIPEASYRSTGEALGLDPLDAVLRQVFFFDTPDLRLEAAGVVVRARRTQGKPDDTVVKLRPVQPDDLRHELRGRSGFGVEVDAMPGGFVCSASFKGKLKEPRVQTVLGGGAPVSGLFSEGQRAFYAENAPDGLSIDDLTVLGPVHVLKLKEAPEGFDGKLVVEMWLYPDGSRILELSTKCEPERAFDTAARTRAFLSERGVDLAGEQETKTRTALEFFAGELAAP